MGYGKKALSILYDIFPNYKGILLEAETIGYGENIEERKRRAHFYQKAGFCPLNYELELYEVIYTPYVLYKDKKISDSKIIEIMFEFYWELASPISKEEFEKKYKCKKL